MVTEEQQPLRILLVEDDEDIARLVLLHLEDLNAHVQHCNRGDTALQQAQAEQWNLIILDLRLPGMNGLDICRELREHGDHTPILMLTAKSTELDRVLGLDNRLVEAVAAIGPGSYEGGPTPLVKLSMTL